MGKWEMVKLGDIGNVITGNTPPTKEQKYYDSNDLQFYKPNDFKELIVNKLKKSIAYVSENAKEKIRFLPSGSVLTTCIGTIGKVGVLNYAATCNQQINAIIPKHSKINSMFLAYCILSKNAYLKNTANAPIVPIINKTQFSKVEIPLPPLQVQRGIAQTLDTASELITLRKKQLAQLDNLIKATFYDMFGDPVTNEKGWEVAKLGCKCNIITGNTPPRADKNNYGYFIEWIKSDNINTDGVYLTCAEEYLSEKGFKLCRYVDELSILMTCIAGSIKCIGNIAIADRRVSFNQQINAIVPKENNILYMYSLFLLTQKYIQSTINMSLKGILSKGKLSELEFVFPPIELQNQFAQIVTKIEEQKALVQKAINESQYLFDSLMAEYFE